MGARVGGRGRDRAVGGAVRRAARTDSNHSDVVAALLSVGATVASLAMVGCGVPDLLVGFRGETFLVEVKDGDKSPSRRSLTDAQRKFHALWRGRPIAVVESPAEALAAIGCSIAHL